MQGSPLTKCKNFRAAASFEPGSTGSSQLKTREPCIQPCTRSCRKMVRSMIACRTGVWGGERRWE
eukprot:1874355-Lingulodinium_polyedra.AAC.3